MSNRRSTGGPLAVDAERRLAMTRYLRALQVYRFPFAIALVAVTALALSVIVDWQQQRLDLEVDPSIRSLLPKHGSKLEVFESIRARYQSDDFLLVTWIDDALFSPGKLAALKRLTKRLEQIPGVSDVESLATALQVRVYEDFTDVQGYLSDLPETMAEAQAVRDAVLRNPLYAGYLVSADGRGAMLAVRFNKDLSARQLIPIVAAIGQASSAEANGVEQFLSGPLYVRLEISRLLLRDLFRIMPLAVCVTLVVAAVGFRTVRGTLLPLLANAFALIATFALFTAAGQTLNYVTVIVPPTIYVVGFAYAIHVVSDFEQHYALGGTRFDAIRAALVDVVVPVSLTALTTAIGFASLALSGIESIQHFGLWASAGTALAWLSALTIVPLGLVLWPGAYHIPARQGPAIDATTAERLTDLIARVAVRHGGVVLIAGSAMSIAVMTGIARIDVGTDYLDNFSPDSELRQNFERMNDVFAGAVPLQVLLESANVDAFKSPDALREVEALKRWLLAQPEIGGVYTVLDYIGVLERALAPDLVDSDPVPESAGLTNHLILLGAGDDVRRFVEPAFSSTLLQVRVQVVASKALNALSARIEQRLAQLPAAMSGEVSGSSYLIARTLDDITRGQVVSLSAALMPIFGVLLLVFRSVSLAALALIPNGLPLVAFFGVLGWCDVPLNLTTSLVASVVLGIAVDDSIHFFARLRAAARQHADDAIALKLAIGGVIRPVSFTTLALGLGFMTLSLGELRSQAEFGALAAFTLVVAWLLDVSFTPALAYRYGMAAAARRD